MRRYTMTWMLAVAASLSGCATLGSAVPVSRLSQPLKAALASDEIGRQLDDKAIAKAAAAEYQALETGKAGAAVTWRVSADVHGSVTPQQPYAVGATNCRRYTHSVSVDGKVTSAAAIACRREDGVWAPLS